MAEPGYFEEQRRKRAAEVAARQWPATAERWPEASDSTEVFEIEINVYGDGALIVPPVTHDDDPRDIPVTAAQLRELAAAAEWAADRLDGRSSDAPAA